MNTKLLQKTSLILGIATITAIASTHSVQAQTSSFASDLSGTQANQVAQTPTIEPGRATRGGSSYVGVAGNVGLSGGETALGIGNFTVISKIGFTETISARPTVVIGDDTTVLVPVTYDFNLRQRDAVAGTVTAAPYVGGGIAIATGSNSDVGPLLTAGVDVPVAERITATGAVHAGFFDRTSVGVVIGAGYNF